MILILPFYLSHLLFQGNGASWAWANLPPGDVIDSEEHEPQPREGTKGQGKEE